MKQMSKHRVIAQNSVELVMNERKLLSEIKHPFIVNMHSAFQDSNNLYLILHYMPGGDLRSYLRSSFSFTEPQTRFAVASVLTALEYLHNKQIIHRDIKPENIVLDNRGYLRITDFGVAKELPVTGVIDPSGTPGYMSPESMRSLPYGRLADYFSLGVVAFEFMKGYRPYVGKTRQQILDRMRSSPVCLNRKDLPLDWGIESADFINKILSPNAENRLGIHEVEELKSHDWLKGFPWGQLRAKALLSPFRPKPFSKPIPELIDSPAGAAEISQHQHLFAGYQFEVTR